MPLPYSPAVSTIAEAIQASLSPVFMLAGVGALLNVLAGRLSRVIDRARLLEGRHPDWNEFERMRYVRELRLLDRRMSIINAALLMAVLSAVMVCLVVAMLFIAVLLRFHMGLYVAISFVTAMLLLIASLTAFMIEVRVSLKAIHVQAELLK